MQVIPESGVHLEFIFLSYITLVDGIKVRKTLEGNVDFEKFEIGKRTKSGNDILSLTSMSKELVGVNISISPLMTQTNRTRSNFYYNF